MTIWLKTYMHVFTGNARLRFILMFVSDTKEPIVISAICQCINIKPKIH